MSVYKTVTCQIDDAELLKEVMDEIGQELGLTHIYSEDGDLTYCKWGRVAHPVRGRDATLVIGHKSGGLDSTPRRYCGDTAFCLNEDGSIRVEIDIAHGNAAYNWQRIQNHYALKKVERSLPRGYSISKCEVDPETGEVQVEIKAARRTEQAMRGRQRRVRERRARR